MCIIIQPYNTERYLPLMMMMIYICVIFSVIQDHPNLRANLCRAIGECCANEEIASNSSWKNIIYELLNFIGSEHQIVRENVILALNGLSKCPLNCKIMNTPAVFSVSRRFSATVFCTYLMLFKPNCRVKVFKRSCNFEK